MGIPNELKHYGVPGMRWGVRKGGSSSSSSGGSRRGSVKIKMKKKSPSKAAPKKTEKQKKLEEEAKIKKIKEQRKKISKNRRSLSDAELQKAVGRLENEKKLRDLTKQDVERGRTPAEKMLIDIGSTTIRTAGVAVASYAIKAALEGNFDRKQAATFIKPKK